MRFINFKDIKVIAEKRNYQDAMKFEMMTIKYEPWHTHYIYK